MKNEKGGEKILDLFLSIVVKNPPSALFAISGAMYLFGQSGTGMQFFAAGFILQIIWLLFRFII